jgi:hypothetical protein
MTKKLLHILWLILIGYKSFSQEKFEKEYRIKENSVPEKAKVFVNKFKFDKKIKWFAEESQDGKTIEAKSYLEGYKYSIEFLENGNLIDVEKEIEFIELTKSFQQKIKNSLASKYKKFKIKKLQIQHKGNEEDVLKTILNDNKIKAVLVHYELVVKATKNKESKRYELLIDRNGVILKELIYKKIYSINLEF